MTSAPCETDDGNVGRSMLDGVVVVASDESTGVAPIGRAIAVIVPRTIAGHNSLVIPSNGRKQCDRKARDSNVSKRIVRCRTQKQANKIANASSREFQSLAAYGVVELTFSPCQLAIDERRGNARPE